MRKNHNIERDPQLAELLKGSFAPRTPDEAEHFTRRVMRRLPQRRRRPFLTMLLAYIQSPFWLVTAAIVCATVLGLRFDFLMERIDSLPALVCVLIASAVTASLFALDILRDVDKA